MRDKKGRSRKGDQEEEIKKRIKDFNNQEGTGKQIYTSTWSSLLMYIGSYDQ